MAKSAITTLWKSLSQSALKCLASANFLPKESTAEPEPKFRTSFSLRRGRLVRGVVKDK
jgi:hypothetical protein